LLNIPRSAFTLQFHGRVRVLSDDRVGIAEAYDPSSVGQHPEVAFFKAIWDTGASGSLITNEVISSLHLNPIDEKDVHTANGPRKSNVYLVNIFLRNKVAFQGVPVTDGDIIGCSVLIGMDIIGAGDFAVTHSDGKTCMSFQIPSSRKIDFVEEINTQSIRPAKTKSKKNRDRKPWEKRRRR
jgi:predicted aspartyl protease